MSIFDSIRSNFHNAIVDKCSEHGCKLVLNCLGNYIVLKGEKICKGCKMPDCIVFAYAQFTIIGIVELKSKTAHVNEIAEKLTNGSRVALSIWRERSGNQHRVELYHIILSKSWRVSEYRMMTSKTLKLRGKKYPIIPKSCGTSLAKLITKLQ